jgi:hypothetical protein
MICGTYKLTGYFDDGSAYSGVISITKTDKGITIKGDIDGYFSCDGDFSGCVSYYRKDLVYITFCENGSISMSDFKVVLKDKSSSIGWVSKHVNEVNVKRI